MLSGSVVSIDSERVHHLLKVMTPELFMTGLYCVSASAYVPVYIKVNVLTFLLSMQG